MSSPLHTSKTYGGDSADLLSSTVPGPSKSLPELHASDAHSASQVTTRGTHPPSSTYPIRAPPSLRADNTTAAVAAAISSPLRPHADWCHPLAALDRQRASAALAYTPYTLRAAEAEAERRAAEVAQLYLPAPHNGSPARSSQQISGVQSRHSTSADPTGSLPALMQPPTPVSGNAAHHPLAPGDAALPSCPTLADNGTTHHLNDGTRLSSVSASSRSTGLLLRRVSSKAGSVLSVQNAAPNPLLGGTQKFLPPLSRLPSTAGASQRQRDSAMARDYAALHCLLRGYSEEGYAATSAAVSEMPTTADVPHELLGDAPHPQTEEVATLPAATTLASRTYPSAAATTVSARTPRPSSEASAATATTTVDVFRHYLAQHQHHPPTSRAAALTRGDVRRFHRHLQRYLDRQLAELLHYEEIERAQLRADAFRALHTLVGLHEQYVAYVELRERKAAAAQAAVQAETLALQELYRSPPLASLIAFESEPPHATEPLVPLFYFSAWSGGQPTPTAPEPFEELEMWAGLCGRRLVAQEPFEELVVEEKEERKTLVSRKKAPSLHESFEELLPVLDFEALKMEDPDRPPYVPPPLEPFEELTAHSVTPAYRETLREPFEELLPRPALVELAASVVTAPMTPILLTPWGSMVFLAQLETSRRLSSKTAVLQEDSQHEQLSLGDSFEELEVSDSTPAKVAPDLDAFQLLEDDGPVEAAGVVDLREQFEELVDGETHAFSPQQRRRARVDALPPLEPFEELRATADIDRHVDDMGEVFEELLNAAGCARQTATIDHDRDALLLFAPAPPEPFEHLEVRQDTPAKVAVAAEPFEELCVPPRLDVAAAMADLLLREEFEELGAREDFEELEPTSLSALTAPLPVEEPFEELVGDTDTAALVAAMQEAFEGLVAEVNEEEEQVEDEEEEEDANSGAPTPAWEPFEELKVSATTPARAPEPADPFQELSTSSTTAQAVQGLQEEFEELPRPTLSQFKERMTPDVIAEQQQQEERETVRPVEAVPQPTQNEMNERAAASPETHRSRSSSSTATPALVSYMTAVAHDTSPTTGYRVGVPEVLYNADGTTRHVSCDFHDLTLDGFAATDIGDDFAAACGVRRPMLIACAREVEGPEWCATLLSASAVLRDCVVADVCAALECAPVRVRNVSLIATAPENAAESATPAVEGKDAVDSAVPTRAGLQIRFEVVHEATFALSPETEVQYLIDGCTFPFLQQWARSRAELIAAEASRRRSDTQPRLFTVETTTAPRANGGGAAIVLWAYTTEAARRVRKNPPRIPAARLSFSPGFESAATTLSASSNPQIGVDADGPPLPMAIPTPPPQPLINILVNHKSDLSSRVSANDDVSVTVIDSMDGSSVDSYFSLPSQPKRKGFSSWKRKE